MAVSPTAAPAPGVTERPEGSRQFRFAGYLIGAFVVLAFCVTYLGETIVQGWNCAAQTGVCRSGFSRTFVGSFLLGALIGPVLHVLDISLLRTAERYQ